MSHSRDSLWVRHLMGCLDAFLFMPGITKRFDKSFRSAVQSFWVPILVFPIPLLLFQFSPQPDLHTQSLMYIGILYSLRFMGATAVFLGIAWFLINKIDRKEHFYQFIVANNWLSLPAALLMVPPYLMMASGAYSWEMVYPLILVGIGYSYLFTAWTASRILRVPLELGGFLTFIALVSQNGTMDILQWAVNVL